MTIGYACVAATGNDVNISGVPYSTQAAAELLPLQTYGTINANAKWASGLNVLGNGGDTFNENVSTQASGAANDEIVLGKYGVGADPIIDSGASANALLILTDNYITVQDIEITNSAGVCVNLNRSDNLTLTNVTIRDGAGIGCAAYICSNVTMTNVTITGHGATGLFGYTETGASYGDCDTWSLTGCNISSNGGNGVHLRSGSLTAAYVGAFKNVTTNGCTFANNTEYGLYHSTLDDTTAGHQPYGIASINDTSHSNGFAGLKFVNLRSNLPNEVSGATVYQNSANKGDGGISINAVDTMTVKLNTIYDNYTNTTTDGCGIILDWAHASFPSGPNSTNITVRHNIVYDHAGTGTTSSTGGAAIHFWAVTNSTAYGNICYKNKNGITGGHSSSTGNSWLNNTVVDSVEANYVLDATSTTPEFTIKNNIGSGGKYGILKGTAAAPIETNNCMFNASIADFSGITKDATSITTDPKFRDAANDDFSLLSTSPCIDAAENIVTVLDNNGYAYLAEDPDIGANKYVDATIGNIAMMGYGNWGSTSLITVMGYDLGVVAVPTTPGKEYSLPISRTHYTLDTSRIHYTMDEED